MQKIIIALLLFFCVQLSNGQDIVEYEYWFDRNVDAKVKVSSSTENIVLDLDVSQLREGIHHYNFRVKDKDGYWSAPVTHYFLRTPLNPVANKPVKYEYWIDRAIDVKQSVADETGIIALDLDVTALREGIHHFNFRSQDVYGHWSAPVTHYFLRTPLNPVANKPVKYEYWIDRTTDAKQSVADETGIIALDLDVTALREGIHHFNFRSQDVYGHWSAPVTHYFLRTPLNPAANKPMKYEYWIDRATEAKQSVADETGIIALDLDVTALREGIHHFNFRAQDVYGHWSAPVTQYFYRSGAMLTNNNIIAYEYWWNDAVNARTTVNIEPVNPLELKDLVLEINDIPVKVTPESFVFMPGMLGGKALIYYASKNQFSIRFKDAYNNWSVTSVDKFDEGRSVEVDAETLYVGTPVTKSKPASDEIHFYQLSALAGDSLMWTASQSCIVQIFNASGEEVCKLTPETGVEGKGIRVAQEGVYYAMLHSVESNDPEITLSCNLGLRSAIDAIMKDGIVISPVSDGIYIETQHPVSISIFNVSGQSVYQSEIAGNEKINLIRGIYIVKINNDSMKIVIR